MWTEIETIWTQSSSSPWIPPTKGVIMGIGTVKIRKEEKLLQAETKRYIAFITESIWNVVRDQNTSLRHNTLLTSQFGNLVSRVWSLFRTIKGLTHFDFTVQPQSRHIVRIVQSPYLPLIYGLYRL